MSSDTNVKLVYKDGTVDVPHLGFTLRSIFGAAVSDHDIVRDGRQFKLTYNGVYIGTLQLKDSHLKGTSNAALLRPTVSRR